MKEFHKEVTNTVDIIIKTEDVRGLVEHAITHISAYEDQIIDYVFENIQDSDELYPEERECMTERIKEIISEFV